MKKIFSKKGQNTVEYILMMTVIIVVLIAVLNPFGQMTNTVNSSLNLVTQGIECMADNTCYGGNCEHKYPQCSGSGPILPLMAP